MTAYDKVNTATGHADITPSDTARLEPASRALFIGTGGNIRVVAVDGTTANYTNVPDAFLLDVQAIQVLATGTTASGIVAMY